jgi:hypothetical protein
MSVIDGLTEFSFDDVEAARVGYGEWISAVSAAAVMPGIIERPVIVVSRPRVLYNLSDYVDAEH